MRRFFPSLPASFPLLGILVALASAPSAQAASYTWANTGTDFNTGTNWLGNVAPGNGDTAVFNVAAAASPNLATSSTLNSIQISTTTASGYNFTSSSGATYTLMSTGTTAGTSALQSAINTGTNTFNSSIIFGAAAGSSQSIYQTSGGALVFNGTLGSTNSISLVLANSGTYFFNSANTYTGTTTMASNATLVLGNKNALSNTTLNLTTATDRIQATTDLTGANKLTNSLVLSGSGGLLVQGSSIIEFAGTVNFSGSARSITNNTNGTIFSGVISNDAGQGLTWLGSGTTFVSGLNTYTGATTIGGSAGVAVTAIGNAGAASAFGTSGTLNLGSTNQTGNLRYNGAGETTDKVINLSGTSGGATIDTTNATGALIFTSNFTASGTGTKTLTLTGLNSGNTIAGSIVDPSAGSVNVTKTGSGSWILSGSNNYSGLTTVSAGVLNLRNSFALGSTSGSTTVASLAAVELQNNISVGETFNIVGTGVGANGVLRNVSGSNTLSGLVALGADSKIQSDAGVFTLSGSVNSSSASVRTLTVDGVGSTVISGNVGPTLALTKVGSGTLTLSGANSYTGLTTVSYGVLNLDFNGTSAPANNIIAATGTLSFTGSAQSATLNIIGKNNAASSQTLSGSTVLAGAGAYHINLSSSGTGTVNLTSALTGTARTTGATLDIRIPTGATVTTSATTIASGALANAVTINGSDFATVNSGTLTAFTGYVINTGTTLSTTSNQIVDMNGGDTTLTGTVQTQVSGLRFNTAAARTITMDPGKLVAIGGGQAMGGLLVTSTVGANLTRITGGLLAGISSRDLVIMQNNTAGDLQIDSIITSLNGNNLGLTKSGAGKLILTGQNTFAGTASYLNEGTVVVTADATVGNTQVLTTGSGSAILTGVDTTGLFVGQRVTGANITTNQGWYIVAINSGTVTMSGAASASGTSSVTFGNSGGLGTQTGAGAVLIGSAANLQVGNGGATGSLTAAQGLTNSGTITINHSNAFTFSNTVSGGGMLVQAGTGTTTLSAVSDYSGATMVSAGTLLVAGSINNSAATVSSGGALGGTGSVGSVTVNAGGAITPGSGGIGTLSTNNGNLAWNGQASGAFGQLKFELSNVDATSDQIALGTGMLDKGTGSVFSFDFQGTGAVGNTYTLITFGSTDFVVGDFSYTNLASGVTGSFVENAGSLQFVTTAVPEPSTIALGAAGLVFLAWRGRRRSFLN